MFCYHLLGLRSGVNDTLTIACIGYSVLGERCNVNPVVALTRFTQTNVTFLPLFTPFGSTGKGVKATLRLLPFVIPYSGTLRYDMTLVLALLFFTKICQLCYLFLLPLFGLRSGIKPSLRYLHWSVRTRRSLRYATSLILTLVLLHK